MVRYSHIFLLVSTLDGCCLYTRIDIDGGVRFEIKTELIQFDGRPLATSSSFDAQGTDKLATHWMIFWMHAPGRDVTIAVGILSLMLVYLSVYL